MNVNNNDWDLFVGMNGDMKVFSFITPDDRNTFAADVKVFFEYLIDNQGFPASEQYLLSTLSPPIDSFYRCIDY